MAYRSVNQRKYDAIEKRERDQIAKLNVQLKMFGAGRCFYNPLCQTGMATKHYVLDFVRAKPAKYGLMRGTSRFKTIEALEKKIHKVIADLTVSR